MGGSLQGLLMLVGAVLASVAGYVIYAHVEEANNARRQAAKERRWAAAFGQLDGRVPPPPPAGANPWRPVVLLLVGLAAGGALLWWLLAARVDERPVDPQALAQQYPGPWRTDFVPEVQRALSAAGAGGCVFVYRAGAGIAAGSFLTYCPVAEGTEWRAYLVWMPSGIVRGPFPPIADIPLPE